MDLVRQRSTSYHEGGKTDMTGKHRKLGFWGKWRRLRVHVQNGQITLLQAILYMTD